MIFWTAVVICILSVLIWWFSRGPRGPKLPGPSKWKCILALISDPIQLFTVDLFKSAKQYPKLFSYPISLNLNACVLHDPTLIKEVMLENDFQNHTSPFRQIFHAEQLPTVFSLIAIRDDEWKRRRRAMAPSFTGPKILPMVNTFEKHVEILCGILSDLKEGEIVDMQQKFSNLTVDILGETAFGSQFGCQIDPSNKLARAVSDFINGLGNFGALLIFPYWYKFPFKKIRMFLSSIHRLKALCRQIVAQRNENKDVGDNNDLLQSLIDLKMDLETGLIPESILFLLAGHETTANLLTWALYLISKHPQVETKIKEELERVLGPNGIPTPDNVQDLEYLDCVIQETLRLYPPAVVTDRESSNDVVIDGHKFTKNSIILIPIWVVHHNEQYWPNPENFDPTRFDSEHKNDILPYSYIPFGGGPRICIGWKFALIESKVALAKLYQKFSFKLTIDTCKVSQGASGLLKPEKLPMKVIKI